MKNTGHRLKSDSSNGTTSCIQTLVAEFETVVFTREEFKFRHMSPLIAFSSIVANEKVILDVENKFHDSQKYIIWLFKKQAVDTLIKNEKTSRQKWKENKIETPGSSGWRRILATIFHEKFTGSKNINDSISENRTEDNNWTMRPWSMK